MPYILPRKGVHNPFLYLNLKQYSADKAGVVAGVPKYARNIPPTPLVGKYFPWRERSRLTNDDLLTDKDKLNALKEWRAHYNDGNSGIQRRTRVQWAEPHENNAVGPNPELTLGMVIDPSDETEPQPRPKRNYRGHRFHPYGLSHKHKQYCGDGIPNSRPEEIDNGPFEDTWTSSFPGPSLVSFGTPAPVFNAAANHDPSFSSKDTLVLQIEDTQEAQTKLPPGRPTLVDDTFAAEYFGSVSGLGSLTHGAPRSYSVPMGTILNTPINMSTVSAPAPWTSAGVPFGPATSGEKQHARQPLEQLLLDTYERTPQDKHDNLDEVLNAWLQQDTGPSLGEHQASVDALIHSAHAKVNGGGSADDMDTEFERRHKLRVKKRDAMEVARKEATKTKRDEEPKESDEDKKKRLEEERSARVLAKIKATEQRQADLKTSRDHAAKLENEALGKEAARAFDEDRKKQAKKALPYDADRIRREELVEAKRVQDALYEKRRKMAEDAAKMLQGEKDDWERRKAERMVKLLKENDAVLAAKEARALDTELKNAVVQAEFAQRQAQMLLASRMSAEAIAKEMEESRRKTDYCTKVLQENAAKFIHEKEAADAAAEVARLERVQKHLEKELARKRFRGTTEEISVRKQPNHKRVRHYRLSTPSITTFKNGDVSSKLKQSKKEKQKQLAIKERRHAVVRSGTPFDLNKKGSFNVSRMEDMSVAELEVLYKQAVESWRSYNERNFNSNDTQGRQFQKLTEEKAKHRKLLSKIRRLVQHKID
jgi:hypothetical protein